MDEIVALIQDEPQVLFAYLFGSVATGKANALSDIDIALYCENECDFLGLYKKIAMLTEKKVDLVDLKRVKNNSLLLDIIREGKVIKDHPNRAMWEINTYHRVLDFFVSTRQVYGY